MSSMTKSIVAEALVEAMETLAFVSPWPTEESTEPASAVKCSIEFTGPCKGKLCMIASEALGWTLAANVMGVDPGDPVARTKGVDALKEMMNVTCGALCRQIAPEGTSELGLPVSAAVEGTSAWTDAVGRQDTTMLDADGSLLAVWMEELP